jgi:hypothetical protein
LIPPSFAGTADLPNTCSGKKILEYIYLNRWMDDSVFEQAIDEWQFGRA